MTEFEKEIEDIWNRYKQVIPKYNGIVLSPKFRYKVEYFPKDKEDIHIRHIFFVGLNPSFNEKAINKILLEKKINGNAVSIFNFEKAKANIGIINGLDDESVNRYSYFKPFREFAEESKVSFSYFDLFLIRCSKQEELLSYLNDEILSDFFKSQLELFIKIISSEIINYENRPIIFLNSLAYGFYQSLKFLKIPDRIFTDQLKKLKEYYCPFNRFTRNKFKNNLKELLKNAW